MLYNNVDSFFQQKAKHNHHKEHGDHACGIVVKDRSEQLFNAISPIDYENPYHERLAKLVPNQNRTAVKYKSSTISVCKRKSLGH